VVGVWSDLIGVLELMLLKYTEYEILSFLKYDEAFCSLTKRSSIMNNPRIQGLGVGKEHPQCLLTKLIGI